jgi:hypothetical protein
MTNSVRCSKISCDSSCWASIFSSLQQNSCNLLERTENRFTWDAQKIALAWWSSLANKSYDSLSTVSYFRRMIQNETRSMLSDRWIIYMHIIADDEDFIRINNDIADRAISEQIKHRHEHSSTLNSQRDCIEDFLLNFYSHSIMILEHDTQRRLKRWIFLKICFNALIIQHDFVELIINLDVFDDYNL